MTWCYECSSSPSIPVFIIGTCVSWRLSIVTPYEQLPLLFRHRRTLLRRRVCPSYLPPHHAEQRPWQWIERALVHRIPARVLTLRICSHAASVSTSMIGFPRNEL